MKILKKNYPAPSELQVEDIYNMHLLFKHEREVVGYIAEKYNTKKRDIRRELYKENYMREDYNKKMYLRSYVIKDKNEKLIVSELMSGEYILCKAC